MTWFKVDDAFGRHAKVKALRAKGARVRSDALTIWLLCGVECAAALGQGGVVDGFVSESDLEDAARPLSGAALQAAAAALVDVGLWTRVDGGWLFHDWEDHQPTTESVRRTREKWKAKKRDRRTVDTVVSKVVSPGDTQGDSTGDTTVESPVESQGESPGVSTPRAYARARSRPVPSRPEVLETCELRDVVQSRWSDSFGRHRGAFAVRDDASCREVARVVSLNAPRVGRTPHQLLDEVLSAYWRQDWPRQRTNTPSVRNLVSQFDRLLSEITKAAPVRNRPFDPSQDTPTNAEEERMQLEWVQNGSQPTRRSA